MALVVAEVGEHLQERARSLIPGISREDVDEHLFALPPLAEQRRIVAKVDELMTLCDQLEASRTEREATRDRLTAASFARLNTSDPETFPTDARFALDALPALTTRPDQIKQIRQTVLNLAVHGKLVPQNSKEEPASKLLQRALVSIAGYAREHRLTHHVPKPIGSEGQLFTPPVGWCWSRLMSVFNVITDGDHQPPPRADRGVAFLAIGNITTGKLNFDGCRLVPDDYYILLPEYRKPFRGDILYTVVGATYGRPALVDTDRPFCVQRHIAIMKPAAEMHLEYLLLLLASPFIYEQATRSTTGAAQPTIALKPLRNFLAPVPPLTEQHRIVAKVTELLTLCDQLDASLTAATTARTRLLEATLREALKSAETPALKAAE